MQRFAVHRAPVGPRLGDGLQAVLGADMDEINGGAGPFGHPQHPAERHIFRLGTVHQRHIVPFSAFFLGQLAVHMLHHIIVFGVHQQHGVQPLHFLHQVVQVAHPHHPGFAGGGRRADVGGEDLDGGKAVFHGLVQRADDVLGDFAQQHQMVGIIGVGIAAPDLGTFLNGLGDVDAGILDGEIEQGGGAAEQGGAADLLRRGGLEVAVAHDGGGDVGVGFDAARHHHHSAGVDDAPGLVAHGAGRRHRHDFLALHRHIPVADAHGRDHLPAANNQIQHSATSCQVGGNPRRPMRRSVA